MFRLSQRSRSVYMSESSWRWEEGEDVGYTRSDAFGVEEEDGSKDQKEGGEEDGRVSVELA